MARDPGEADNGSQALRRTGRDPGEIIAAANRPDIDVQLAAGTDAARSLGHFGSPRLASGTEIFRGDDRLEQAVEWCTSH